jgi:hypothetical protein
LTRDISTVKYEDCNSLTSANLGCGVSASNPNSFGPNFNNVGGGYFVLERTGSFMKIWFWQRGDPSTPPNVVSGGSTVTTDGWPEPGAYFPSTNCNFQKYFSAHNIIINLTLCMYLTAVLVWGCFHMFLGGVWAGPSYNANGCPGDCASRCFVPRLT